MERKKTARLFPKIRFSRAERKILGKIHFSLAVSFLECTFVYKMKRSVIIFITTNLVIFSCLNIFFNCEFVFTQFQYYAKQ